MKRSGKGNFGPWQLPISSDYIRLRPHNRFLMWGALSALGVTLLVSVNFLYLGEGLLSAGPISAPHAFVEEDCNACHVTGKAVSDALCNECHESRGETDIYSFATHYIYRLNPPGETRTLGLEGDCSSCHGEHLGRKAALTDVSDNRCLGCHSFGSFNQEHPPFDFSVEGPLEEPGIRFSHIFHTLKVATEYQLDDAGRACLFCHVAESEGRHFEELSFDLHCASCHLKPPIRVGPLPVSDRVADGEPALLSLEGFRRLENPPGWAAAADPGEFSRPSPGVIVKSIVDHRDRWVLANLSRIKAASGTGSPPSAGAEARGDLERLYRRTLDELRDYASGLSEIPEPELLRRLSRIQTQLAALERELERPESGQEATGLTAEQRELAEAISEPCRLCHTLQGASLRPVLHDQRILNRAEFDHRSHLAAATCIECHDRIPFQRALDARQIEDGPALAKELGLRGIAESEFAEAFEVSPDDLAETLSRRLTDPEASNAQRLLSTWSRETEVDRAAVQNIPGIGKCRECHQPEAASADCVNCHYFHPEKGIPQGRSFTFR